MQPHYYRSERAAKQSSTHHRHQPVKPRKRRLGSTLLISVIVIVIVAFGIDYFAGSPKAAAPGVTTAKSVSTKKASTSNQTATTAPVNQCASNTLSQRILVSISQRHLWACQANQVVYNSAVITGISYLAADVTPVGTYHIYAKETDQVLKGCDSTGCWNDNVSYWMPFLDNQYGAYGFHDATWRTPSQFGTISPDSAQASHGCVECPLATAAWLYSWDQVGTTVTIEA